MMAPGTAMSDQTRKGKMAMSTGAAGRERRRAQALAKADAYYLSDDHVYGCAETVFLTLKDIYGLDDPMDASAAMAFNGGVAYSGGPCGAITGGAMAVGILAERRISDHKRAKTVARELVYETMLAFEAEHGAVDCRSLIRYDLRAPGEHQAFIDSGLWRDVCAAQIHTVVGHLAELADRTSWDAAVERVEAAPRR